MKSGKSLSAPEQPDGLSNAVFGACRAVVANPSRSWTVRITRACLLAIVFLLVVRFTVVELLPKNRLFYHEFTFQLGNSESADKHTSLWDHFSQQQKQIILELARNTSPALSRELIVTRSHSSSPNTLVLCLSYPCDNKNITREEEFRRLITDYAKYRRPAESEWADNVQQPQTRSKTSPPYRFRKSEEYNQRLQELILLQSEYARMDAQSVVLEHRLLPAIPANNPADFGKFMQPYVQNALAQDGQWHHLNQWLDKLRSQRAELDIKCGQCDSTEQLEILLQQREQVELQYNQEKRNLDQRRELITEMVRLECWGPYQEHLKIKIQEKQQAMIANSDQQLVLKVELDRLKNRNSRPLPPSASPANSTDTTVGSRNIEFRPRFIRTANRYETRETFSRPQYLIMASATFLGAALGLLIGTGRVGKKINVHNVSSKETEKAQQEQEPPKPKEPPYEVIIHPLPDKIDPPEIMVSPEAIVPSEEIEQQEEQPEEQAEQPVLEKPEEPQPQEEPEEQTAETDSSDHPRSLAETVEHLGQQVGASPVILLAVPEFDTASPRTAVNLAISLTRSSLEVLLVEADLDRHDLAAVFELPESPGFYEWRRGEIWASRAITPTSLTGLSFMHTGDPSPQQCSSEVDISRESHRWSNLRRGYDVTVIYCPAALSVLSESSDTRQLASAALLDLVDGVFVLTRTAQQADSPPPPQIETLLENRRARFLGSIAINA
ncbi:MAG: hypothetical protein KAJ46_02225 [Sedimentisphaerales bacterium]|nr:hypothetical protein [Sedimentisphaerales bacterium]